MTFRLRFFHSTSLIWHGISRKRYRIWSRLLTDQWSLQHLGGGIFPVTSSVLPWLRLNQNITGYGRQGTVFSAHDTRRSCRSGYETTAPLRSLPNVDVVAPVHSAFTSTMYSVIRRQSARMLYARTVSTRVVDLWPSLRHLLHSYHCCMMTEANWRVSTNFHVFSQWVCSFLTAHQHKKAI